MSHRLTLYYRPECSLCETMHRELMAYSGGGRLELSVVDIDSSEQLIDRYGHKVPVLADGSGYEICHYFLDLQALEAYFLTH